MEKIKILYAFIRRPFGGVESYVKRLTSNLNKDLFSFSFIFGDYDETEEFIKFCVDNNYDYKLLPSISIKNYFTFKKQLKQFLNTQNYDIIHCHSLNSGFFYLKTAKKMGITNRALHVHSSKYSDRGLYRKIRNFLLSKMSKKYANHYIACDVESANFAFRRKSKQVFIANNFIDAEKFKYNENERNRIRKDFCFNENIILGHVGGFLPVKNHIFMVDLINELLRKNDKYRLVFIGDGPLKKNIVNYVSKLGLNKYVIFTGHVTNVEMYYSAMDVFLLPSKFEGYPFVSIEALASGLPVIASNRITRNIDINGRVEFLGISSTDIELWADKIESLKFMHDRQSINSDISMSKYNKENAIKTMELFYNGIVRKDL